MLVLPHAGNEQDQKPSEDGSFFNAAIPLELDALDDTLREYEDALGWAAAAYAQRAAIEAAEGETIHRIARVAFDEYMLARNVGASDKDKKHDRWVGLQTLIDREGKPSEEEDKVKRRGVFFIKTLVQEIGEGTIRMGGSLYELRATHSPQPTRVDVEPGEPGEAPIESRIVFPQETDRLSEASRYAKIPDFETLLEDAESL